MPADNQIYNRPGDIWWDESQPLSTLRTMLNPARFAYFRAVLQRLGVDPRGLATLDVGCGGGLLAEEFARLGCCVTGVDPSAPSLATARRHAARSGLDIDYLEGVAEALPFEDGAFRLVYCCDVLEHVNDLGRSLTEIGRVLQPGGLFLYDTVNRTWVSKLVAIKLAQEWRATRFLPAGLHDWNQFIKPAELDALMRARGLEPREVVGLTPGPNPLVLAREYVRFRAGSLTVGDFGRRIRYRASRDLSGSYAGYALKVAGDADG